MPVTYHLEAVDLAIYLNPGEDRMTAIESWDLEKFNIAGGNVLGESL